MVAGYRFLSPSDYIAVARGKASGRHPGSEALQTPHPGGCASNYMTSPLFTYHPGKRLAVHVVTWFLSRSDYSAVARGKASGRHPG